LYGEEQDAWLDIEGNLLRWEGKKMTASERRILMATSRG
jgi:hypothetical protein